MLRDWIERIRRPSRGTPAEVLRPSPDVRAVAAEDGLAVFHMGRGAMFKSNAIGSEIWRTVIEQQRDTHSVAKMLAGRFGVPADQAEQDVSRFLAQLQEQELVCQG
jgi:hypothetical protein